ncbi:hypothetical protein [Streptomyces stackebrandtii]|uniref:hypothetical protein n=1 Tax=Streptomyces stackebrandtii TaxID=3051177 RepID=UPI0028DC7CE7|nr:hypothetical protein [Streptomyces sp. DSM 40976]
MPEPTAEPAIPAGRRTRPAPGAHRWVALLLILTALFGAGAANALPGGAELRAAAPASDTGGETFDPAAAEAGLPGRARRHRTRVRPAPARRRRAARRRSRTTGPAPVSAPRGGAPRREVMRC